MRRRPKRLDRWESSAPQHLHRGRRSFGVTIASRMQSTGAKPIEGFGGWLPDHRGAQNGVAKGLLEHLLEWCRTQEIEEVYLGKTAKFLAAHRFYEKNGFREISRAGLPMSFPVMVVDNKFYVKALP